MSKLPILKPKKCIYRSLKNFYIELYQKDLENINPIPEYQDNVNVNELYNTFTNALTQVIDKHAPVKSKLYKKQPVPYMNSELN